jgi:DNA-directed RNA polymerase beta' subunit
MVFQIETIQFGILSDQDALAKSVCEVNKPSLCVEEGSVYDPRLGCVDNISTCETCSKNIWECTGHFGHIKLVIPVIIFYKQVATMLKIFCHNCHRLLNTKEELSVQGIKGYDKIVEHLSNMSFCGHCSEPHPEIRVDGTENKITVQYKHKNEKTIKALDPIFIKQIFDNITDSDVAILGVDPTMFHPRSLVRMIFNVIPTCCRPRMVTPDNISDDDLSISLVDIIKKNNLLLKGGLPQEKYEETATDIKTRILTYCDNSKGLAVHSTNHKPLTGLKERITRKSGHIRQNIMGKRCNLTARTVAGPDPTLKLNELAVPEEIANIITIPEFVTDFNIEKLTDLVNTVGKASTICKKDGSVISVPTALIKHGTILRHGDVIERNGKKRVVTNCKIPLQKNDVITRQLKDKIVVVPTTLPEKRRVEIAVGDKINRFLQDGDYVLLNRQPTLHRNSMQGMKIKIRPGKTFRTNLSIAAGFNLDFDGDELNLFAHETLESRAELQFISNAKNNILSAQCNKSEMVIVQDSLLGVYKMTEKQQYMSRDNFMQCITSIDHDYEFHERLETIRRIRNEEGFSTHALFGFILPDDFHISYKNGLTIKNGVLLNGGFLEKSNLSKSPNSIIRLLDIEYSSDVAARFIDNVQFLTNTWLTMNPFSINIYDCLINNDEKRREIRDNNNKYFMEADNTSRTTDNPQIQESRVNCALNKAKDIGLKIAKESLRPDNNFISTVTSGSKGDYFNIAQMTGLLGQQNLDGQRPKTVLDNGTRTLIHYPRTIKDSHRKYRSRGFVASSFIEGMKPDEMFFHAMTGREGMIKTSMGTATSGYAQRSILKLHEDIKIEYDGTVRDAKKNIYQFMYGNHGFDPSKVDIHKNSVVPVNFERLAGRLNTDSNADSAVFLTVEEIEEIVEKCIVPSNIPTEIKQNIDNIQSRQIRESLSKIQIDQGKIDTFKNIIVEKYNTLRITPGECVGIISAQSIGERQTQTTLNTFHTAGKLQQSGVGRLEELLNMTKKLRVKTCTIFFNKKFETSEELRSEVGSSFTYLTFSNIVTSCEVTVNISEAGQTIQLNYDFDTKMMFDNRITPYKIAEVVKDELCDTFDIECQIKPTGLAINIYDKDAVDPLEYQNIVSKIHICGMKGVSAFHLDHDGNEWFVVTEGSNLRKMLAHPLIDNQRLYCNDVWEVYECLGIAATRKMLLKDLKKVVCGINLVHIQLLVDKMTFKGKPCSITRYTMRNNDVGPLSKATFEESTDILINAAMKTEIENNAGVSASIISGRQPKIGTGFMALLMDYTKLMEKQEPEETYY